MNKNKIKLKNDALAVDWLGATKYDMKLQNVSLSLQARVFPLFKKKTYPLSSFRSSHV